MKRLFLVTAIAGILGLSSVNAQTKDVAMTGSKLGIGAEFAFPTGDAGDLYDFGYGGSLQFQTPIANKLNFIATGGYLNFQGKEFVRDGIPTVKVPDYGVVPLKVGARYFIAENFYAGGELGAAIGTSSGAETAFIYTPHIGVEFPVADKSTIDLSARYEAWSGDNIAPSRFVGLRLAYNFGL